MPLTGEQNSLESDCWDTSLGKMPLGSGTDPCEQPLDQTHTVTMNSETRRRVRRWMRVVLETADPSLLGDRAHRQLLL